MMSQRENLSKEKRMKIQNFIQIPNFKRNHQSQPEKKEMTKKVLMSIRRKNGKILKTLVPVLKSHQKKKFNTFSRKT
jgi:hypothetical protein